MNDDVWTFVYKLYLYTKEIRDQLEEKPDHLRDLLVSIITGELDERSLYV